MTEWKKGGRDRPFRVLRKQGLRVNSPLLGGGGDAIDGQHVGRDAVVDVVGFRVSNDVVEALGQDGVQLLVDDSFLPEITLTILHPFEVGGGDSSGVGEDVGDDEDFLVGKDLVSDRSGGAVGAFADDAGLDAIRIARGDDILSRGGDEDIAVRNDAVPANRMARRL